MNKMKYIIYDSGMLERPVIFDESTHHNQMAADLGITNKIVSAGFVILTTKGLECYGDSFSLKIKSRPEDSKLINKMLGANDG